MKASLILILALMPISAKAIDLKSALKTSFDDVKEAQKYFRHTDLYGSFDSTFETPSPGQISLARNPVSQTEN